MFKKIILFLILLGLISSSQALIVASTTFNSAMGSSDSTIFDIVRSPDTLVSFGYDWSNLSTDDPTNSGYTTVPVSPNGDFTGLRVECNNGDGNGFKENVTLYPNVTPTSSDYDLIVDIYGSYTLPWIGGGGGSTWHTGITAFASGTVLNTITDTDLSAMDPAYISFSAYTSQDGVSFGVAPDSGDTNSEWFCFMPSARASAPNTSQFNGQVGTWTGTDTAPVTSAPGHRLSSDPVYFSAMNFPPGRDTTSYLNPGYVWNTLKEEIRGNTVSFYVNNVKFCSVVSSLTTKRVGILVTDPYTSIASPLSEEYVLVDNVKIIEYNNTTDVNRNNWMLFQ